MPTQDGSPIGVIAGAGRFPFMVVDGAKRAGCRVVVVGLRGLADPELRLRADAFHWAGLAGLGRWMRLFSAEGVHRAIMAGYVHKSVMYGRARVLKLLPDWTAFKLWFFELDDKRNDAILSAVADKLGSRGITLQDATAFCPEALAAEGHLGGPEPSSSQKADLSFGWRIAKELGRLDIGQAVAVKETEVIAVEAIEGTDRMIERAGVLCKHGGWTLIKVSKPNQDMRFDIPTVGPDTITRLREAGAKALVIEAGKTVVIERERMVSLARRAGISVIAVGPPAESND